MIYVVVGLVFTFEALFYYIRSCLMKALNRVVGKTDRLQEVFLGRMISHK